MRGQRIVVWLLIVATVASARAELTWTSGAYRYDGAGRIVAIGNASYGYDAAGRLTRAQVGVTPVATYAYEYDPYGNRVAYSIDQQRVGVPVSPATNRFTDATYDAAGNQLARGATSATYDGFGMATSYRFDAANAEAFVYTANDERIGVLRGDAWTWSLRDGGGRVLRQYRSSSTNPHAPWSWVEDFVYRGPLLLGSERAPADGARRHHHLDHLGSPRLVTSATGAILSGHDYLPFGEERTSLGQHAARGFDREPPHRFTGHERDFDSAAPNGSSASIDSMHARYYAAATGRFLSVDPAMDLKRITREPQRWNRYTYVVNDPVNKFDPDGREDPAEMAVLTHNVPLPYSRDTPEGREATAMAFSMGMSMMSGGPALGAARSFLMRNPRFALMLMGWGIGMTGGVTPVRTGQIGEELAGIAAAKIRVPIPGTLRTRIPDELTATTLREIKNVAYQPRTMQVRDFLEYAKNAGVKFVLEVRGNTQLSKPLQQLVDEGVIELRRTLPNK